MNQEKKLDEISTFTKEVEGTIDSLFNPSKKIEIDPITNEVKEVDPAISNEEALELQLEPEPVEPETSTSEPAVDSEQVDLTLELETDEVITSKHKEWVRTLQEHMMTLEWEVTPESIDVFSQSLREIPDNLPEEISNLPKLMEKALINLKAAPSDLCASTLPALKLGLHALAIHIKDREHPDATRAVEEAVKALKQTAHKHVEEPEVVTVEEQDNRGKTHHELIPDVPIPNAANSKTAVEKKQNEFLELDAEDISSTTNEKTKLETEYQTIVTEVKEHLEVLRHSTEKIAPVEALLAGRKGLEKLYYLLNGLRTTLESERKKLTLLVGEDFVPVKIEKPLRPDGERVSTSMSQQETASVSGANAEYEQLLMGTCAGRQVAFLPQEVCCHFKLTPKMLKKIEKNGYFQLAMLKKWPWSKISKIVSGELATLGDKALQKLILPIKKISSPIGAPATGKTGWGVVLFKNNKGTVFFIDDEPQLMSPSKDTDFILITLKTLSREPK